MAWSNFEHQLWKTLKQHDLDQETHFVLAVSGGIDSMALFESMATVKPQAQLTVAYFHHGVSDHPTQTDYRNQCERVIRQACERFSTVKIEFKTEQSKTKLLSEASMREARWNFLKSLTSENQPILTAHHLDDWVETLTLKLIRGVGPEGFTSFKAWDGVVFRPFLECHKAELKEYIDSKHIEFIEDPSNESDHYLRNWLRHEWFRSLDEKNPSGYQNYSRSLLQLQQSLVSNQSFSLQFYQNKTELGLDRNWFFSLSNEYQLKALALFLRQHRIFDFTQGQLKEINKRLDKNQKDLIFTVIHVKWVINATQIMLAF
ncbi:MAG: tRNA lysidine(34) synthetase TilS [Bdellovibrio sp.]|nr:tRNA lysidine(34) synthetase TilS [Bdellovibrio sp.]